MKKLSLIFAAVFIFGVGNVVKAQDEATTNHVLGITIPTINLVDLEKSDGSSATNLTWSLTNSIWGTEAGDFNTEPIASSETFYLQYTSVVAKNETNKITAELSSNELPGAITLQVKTSATAKASSKRGKTGAGTGDTYKSLSSSAEDIVTNIKTGYTGTDEEDGHTLNYQLVINPDYSDSEGNESFEDLVADTYSATVLYTITDN